MNQVSIFNRQGVRAISADATAGLGAGAHPRISIMNGRFTLIDAGGTKYPWPNLTMPVVIIGANPKVSKVYYADGYDPTSAVPPTCFSDNGIAPSMNASAKQARTCAECPLGAWGSDTSQLTGKATKACNDKKKLAVLVVGDTAGLVYELQIPPVSLKNLAKYSQQVGSYTAPGTNRPADVCDLVTSISFVPDQVGVVDFAPAAFLDAVGPDGQIATDQSGQPVTAVDGGAAIAAKIDGIWDTGSWEELVGIKDVPWSGSLRLPAPAQSGLANPTPIQHTLSVTSANPVHHLHNLPQPFAGPPNAVPQQPIATQAAAPKPRGGPRQGAGRPTKEMVAAREAAQTADAPTPNAQVISPQAPADASSVPPFLRRTPVPGPMQQASPPPSGIQNAIKTAFALPTRSNQ